MNDSSDTTQAVMPHPSASSAVRSHDPGGKSKPRWPADSTVTARFSACGRYRYELAEVWDAKKPSVMWLLMNPSVAGVEHGDPTLLKTGRYSRRWGYGGQLLGNVHAYRVTDSKRLTEAADPVGPDNDTALLSMAKRAATVVLAYGKPPKPLQARAATVVAMLTDAGVRLQYLRLAKDGTPCHPLYLPGDLEPLNWSPSARVD